MKKVMHLTPLLFVVLVCFSSFTDGPKVGQVIDNFNGVPVFYNGHISNVIGRHVSSDGYNFGLKYQCVEFVKRYYYLIYDHKMPNSYGHAKDFFDISINHGDYNRSRGLIQFRNAYDMSPQIGDILVYDAGEMSLYGHIAIISKVEDDYIEVVQQNWGEKSRQILPLVKYDKYFTIADYDVLGWLRK